MYLPGLHPRMPEFSRGLTWINSKPLGVKSLLGKVVLVDFFTSSCAVCKRGHAAVRSWQSKYGRRGFLAIGIHVPEFVFERDADYVKAIVKERGITHPIVLDEKYLLWNAYRNRQRPERFVVNTKGRIVYHDDGNDNIETEQAIRDALIEAGKTVPEMTSDAVPHERCRRSTPDMYLGYLRGSLGNAPELLPDVEEAFSDTGIDKDDVPYLHGHWKMTKEYIEHTRSLPLASEYIAIRYSAFALNVVMGAKAPLRVEVRLDDQPIPESLCGEAVCRDGEKTVIDVIETRIYEVIRSDTYHRGTLKILVAGEGFRCYVMSSESCQDA